MTVPADTGRWGGALPAARGVKWQAEARAGYGGGNMQAIPASDTVVRSRWPRLRNQTLTVAPFRSVTSRMYSRLTCLVF
jgi:hypothetical protein